MLSVALETSTALGGIAIADGGELLAESTLSVRATHSETVLDELARLLERAGRGPGDLDRVVVGAGPGSFTGVRIAAALAKGLCHALDVPLYAYSSLRALAGSVPRPRVCALFDARRGEVYAEAWPDGVLGAAALGPCALRIDDLIGRLDDAASWIFAGEGAAAYADEIRAVGAHVLPGHLGLPRAATLLWLSREDPSGRVADAADWEPLYVRASGAEREAARV